jgi:serine/threonine-protein kinase
MDAGLPDSPAAEFAALQGRADLSRGRPNPGIQGPGALFGVQRTGIDAYTLYLQAELLAKRRSSRDALRAHDYLQQALRLDPKFALAWSALAELYTNDSVEWSEVFPADDIVGQGHDLASQRFLLGTNKVSLAAHDAAQRALALDPDNAESHWAMARVLHWFDFDWRGAAAENQKAREIDPANARILEQSAQLAISAGRLAEGLALAKQAATLDPLGMVFWEIGGAHHRLGDLEAAAEAYRHLIELYPARPGVHFRYGLVLLSLQQPQLALEQFEQDEPWYRNVGITLALDQLGRRAEADRSLATAERNWGNGMAYQISYIYAARGDPERALAWLERACRQRDAGPKNLTSQGVGANSWRDSRRNHAEQRVRHSERRHKTVMFMP